MFFKLVTKSGSLPSNARSVACLLDDRWDDWGKYRTQFQLIVFDAEGELHRVGEVKIGHIGLLPGKEIAESTRAPAIEHSFDELPEHYFSLGQSENYYETLNTLSSELREQVLLGLRDLAWDIERFSQVENEDVVSESLLRGLSLRNVRTKFSRLAKGNAKLTPFKFSYLFPRRADNAGQPPDLEFLVTPDSVPLTNVHVVVGRNGAGKTTCMHGLGRALLGVASTEEKPVGTLSAADVDEEWQFSGLVFVAFSAFDDFEMPPQVEGLKAELIGLRNATPDGTIGRPKTPKQLEDDFAKSLNRCQHGPREKRWLEAVVALENDPLFKEANVGRLVELEGEIFHEYARTLFKKLSSGHKIVLLTITRLVELVDERTLVLLDEPEGHLHPPLLSSFVRALSDLLIKRNGVAIVATHSPVVLQGVPASCVWLLRRQGLESAAERPEMETFGENVGVLTHAVFGLEVTNTGFHKLISDAVEKDGLDFEGVRAKFESQLGAEALAIARGLVANRDRGD